MPEANRVFDTSAGRESQTTSGPRRSKYTPQACIACRRRKLKCCGSTPCQRCVRQRVRCDYPGKVQPTESSSESHSYDNPTNPLEKRLARIEAKLDQIAAGALERGPRLDNEPDQGVEDFQGDTAFRAPVTAFNDNLETVRARLGISESPTATVSAGPRQDRLTPSQTAFNTHYIYVGTSPLKFPDPTEYESYLAFFFTDINPCHSCVNEADFRSKSALVVSLRRIGREDICFLALNYIIFACADILQDIEARGDSRTLPGWKWFLLADHLVGKSKVGGRGDTSLVQFLVYEAFYLMHADKPNAAYNSIGLACRRCFQFGLHNQSTSEGSYDEYTEHMRQRLLWTVYFVDRRISLSCGRPYGIRDSDIHVDLPAFIDDAQLRPNHQLPAPNPFESSIPYLCSTIAFSRLAGEVWDRIFAAGVSHYDSEAVVVLDAKIKHWIDFSLPQLPLTPLDGRNTRRHHRQHTLIITRFNHLRLLLRRRTMVSLEYDALTGHLCGELAKSIIDRIGLHRDEIIEPSSFRFHMAVSLGGAVLVLAALIVRDLSQIGIQDVRATFTTAFNDGVTMLDQLSIYLTSAKRIADDLKPIIQVANSVDARSAATGYVGSPPNELDGLFPPGVIDFAQQATWFDEPFLSPIIGPIIGTENAESMIFESWEPAFNSTSAGYGAPWI